MTTPRCVLKTAHQGPCLYVETETLPWWYCGKAETDEDWYRRFKEAQDTNNEQIKNLTKDLIDEKDVRRSGQDELTRAVQGITQSLSFLRGAAWFVMGTLGIALAVFLVWLGVRWQAAS